MNPSIHQATTGRTAHHLMRQDQQTKHAVISSILTEGLRKKITGHEGVLLFKLGLLVSTQNFTKAT